MSSKKFYNLPAKEKKAIFQKTAEEAGIPPYAVEKDWWVVQVLSVIFEMEIGAHLVFKGGTSLSKGWKLIERFSEDIDLAVDRTFLGFEGHLSRSKRTRLRKEAKKYITETLAPEIRELFMERGIDDAEIAVTETTASDQDPNIINIFYPNVIESPGYIKPRVQLEIGCRSLREPFSIQAISSLVDENFAGDVFAQGPISIPTVRPERTMLEKLFLLHEEFQRPLEKIRVERLSRHLYDVYQLSRTDFAKNAIQNKELYETIVGHRHEFTRVGGVNYNLHQPQTLNPIPIEAVFEKWRADYKTMQEQMIYGDSPSFDVLVQSLREFVENINGLTWTMEKEFPVPQQ